MFPVLLGLFVLAVITPMHAQWGRHQWIQPVKKTHVDLTTDPFALNQGVSNAELHLQINKLQIGMTLGGSHYQHNAAHDQATHQINRWEAYGGLHFFPFGTPIRINLWSNRKPGRKAGYYRPILVRVIKQPWTRRCCSSRNPFRGLYMGAEYHREQLDIITSVGGVPDFQNLSNQIIFQGPSLKVGYLIRIENLSLGLDYRYQVSHSNITGATPEYFAMLQDGFLGLQAQGFFSAKLGLNF